MAVAKATPKPVSISVNYFANITANLEKLGSQYKYEKMTVGESETRTYNVEGMSEEAIDEFVTALREDLKEKVDLRVMQGYEEIFE